MNSCRHYFVYRDLSLRRKSQEKIKNTKYFSNTLSKCIEKDADIPEKYRNESYCDEWEKIKGDADEIKKAIAKIH